MRKNIFIIILMFFFILVVPKTSHNIMIYDNRNNSNALNNYIHNDNQILEKGIVPTNNSYIWSNKKSNVTIDDLNNNSFIDDINKYKLDDSVIFYDIAWIAALHKYTPIAHLIKILELNPNQVVFLIINKQSFTEDKLNLESLKKKFPNFDYVFYERDIQRFNYHYYGMQTINNLIKKYNLENRKKVLFTSDHVFTVPAVELNNISIKDKGEFKRTFLDLFDFAEINIIADGTAANRFWGNKIFNYFRTKQIFEYDLINKNYPNSIKFMDFFSNLNLEDKQKFIDSNQVSIKDILLLWLTGSINSQNKYYSKINFLIPALETLIDINDPTSQQLTDNENYFNGLFFNPYNTVNLNLIKLFQLLNENSINLLCEVLKIENITKYEKEFENSNNYIYSTKLMKDDSYIINYEARRIINIFKDAKTNLNNIKNKKIKIWIKHHPRDYNDAFKNLKNEIDKIAEDQFKEELLNSIYYLEKSVPFEIYFSLKTFNNLEDNRSINLYITFSTIAQLIRANNQEDIIKHIIVNDRDVNEITLRFGTNSSIFKKNKFLFERDLKKDWTSFIWIVFGTSFGILLSISFVAIFVILLNKKGSKGNPYA